jgi:hypothetical protein
MVKGLSGPSRRPNPARLPSSERPFGADPDALAATTQIMQLTAGVPALVVLTMRSPFNV